MVDVPADGAGVCNYLDRYAQIFLNINFNIFQESARIAMLVKRREIFGHISLFCVNARKSTLNDYSDFF